MKQHLSGVLLLDKPVGLTSNEALQVVKKLFRAKKVGHTGSLDPIATGMLPLCFGEATKFSRFLLEADKRYLVTGKLGEVTSSGDNETPVTLTRETKSITLKNFAKVLPRFRGEILQTPPMYSAIKHKGQPLYKLARRGIEVTRNPRKITIYNLELLEFKNDLAKFAIHCSKGTYIRTLIADIGEALGSGAHTVALRRLTVGPYQDVCQMITLSELQLLATKQEYDKLNSLLLPIETMLINIPEITLTQDMVHYVISGQVIFVPGVPTSGWVKLKNKDGKFLGVGEILQDGRVAPRKIMI